MNNVATALARTDHDLDLRQVAARLWRAHYWIVLSVALFTGVLAAIALLMQPVYRATVMLAPVNANDSALDDSPVGSLGGLAALAGDIGVPGGTRTQEALAVMRSREFIERFIVDHRLLPELYASIYDARQQSWTVADDRQPTLARAYKYFNEISTAAVDPKTGLVKVQIDWRNPRQAATWANELVVRLNAVMRQRAIERSSAYIGYLEKELTTTPEITARAALGRLLEAQIRERMLATVNQEYALRVIDRALIPDARDPLRPKKLLLVMLGALVGLLVGAGGVFVYGATRPAA